MYLSYYKFPELQLLDPERCSAYINSPKCEHFLLWDNYKEEEGMICEALEDGSVKELPYSKEMYKEQLIERQLDGGWAKMVDNVYYISNTFEQAMMKCFDIFIKMAVKWDVLLDVHENCCIIWRGSCYFLYGGEVDKDGWKRIYIMRTMFGGVMTYYADFHMHPTEGIKQMWLYEADDGGTEAKFPMDRLSIYLQIIYLPLIFKKYSRVEMEIVPKNKTLKKSQILKDKVNNFMGIEVKVLDSRWFTTICRNEGFAVKGHFRLQPKKDENGNWTKELIYIYPFVKHGYHRQALKLSEKT